MTEKKWFLNGCRGSGRTIRLLCEIYENKIADLEKENALLKGRNEGFEQQIMSLLIKYEEVYKRFPDLKSAMDKAKAILKENEELKKENTELKEQIEKMKCCENCDRFGKNETEQEEAICDNCINLNNWQLRSK